MYDYMKALQERFDKKPPERLVRAVQSAREEVREGMDAYFSKLYELLSAIPADTISRTNALCLAFYQSKHSVQARMRLAMLCVRLRNKIFYSTEKDLSFSVLRAIYFPVSCSDYFRYFMYR